MTFTWNSTSSTFMGTSLAWIRWRVGDTDSTDPLQSDEEINLSITTYGSKFKAAAAVARAIAAKFSRKADTTTGQFRVAHQQKAQAYMAIAKDLEMGIASDAGRVGAISISVSDSESEREDTDRPPPSFSVRMLSDVETQISVESESTDD